MIKGLAPARSEWVEIRSGLSFAFKIACLAPARSEWVEISRSAALSELRSGLAPARSEWVEISNGFIPLTEIALSRSLAERVY